MTDSEKKSGKRKELSQGQLKALASDLGHVMPDNSERPETWKEFASLPQSERRKVLDLLVDPIRDASRAKVLLLSRITLSGGVSKKHEVAFKSVVEACNRLLRMNEGGPFVVRQLLIDLIDPTEVGNMFELPNLHELDAQEIAKLPGLASAFADLITSPEFASKLGQHVGQWSRLLAAMIVDRAAVKSISPRVASAILALLETLPLKSRPLELRLAEGALKALAGRDSGQPGEQLTPLEAGALIAGIEKAVKAAPELPRGLIDETATTAEALELLRKVLARVDVEQEEKKNGFVSAIQKLESDLKEARQSVSDLESQLHRLDGEVRKLKAGEAALRTEVSRATGERDAAVATLDELRRELDLVGGINASAVDAAKGEVRRNLMKLSLLPLQSLRAFAERLRSNPGSENPDLLVVPLRTIIQVLHRQGFATETEIAQL